MKTILILAGTFVAGFVTGFVLNKPAVKMKTNNAANKVKETAETVKEKVKTIYKDLKQKVSSKQPEVIIPSEEV